MSAATRRWVRITRRRLGRAAAGPAILGAAVGAYFYYDDLVAAREESEAAARRHQQEPRPIPFDWGWLLLNAAAWSAVVVGVHALGNRISAAVAVAKKPFGRRR